MESPSIVLAERPKRTCSKIIWPISNPQMLFSLQTDPMKNRHTPLIKGLNARAPYVRLMHDFNYHSVAAEHFRPLPCLICLRQDSWGKPKPLTL